MSASVLTVEDAKKAKIEVIEDEKGNHAVHEVVVAMRAARRSGTACAKTRAEVNRSGKKPWKQKGTGRARAGSAGSPVWVGGGVAFGPRPRDYSKKVNKKVSQLAFRKALSSRITDGDVLVVDTFAVKEAKTKEFCALIDSHAPGARRTLVVTEVKDENTKRASRNVENAVLISASGVNTEQLLAFDKIIVTREALQKISERIARK
ncbi:MAG: 50S ribosomal protein L4 [Chthoniobacterales bacterium]